MKKNNFNTISQMFNNTVLNNRNKPLINYKENNRWVKINGEDIKLTVSSISQALCYRGIKTQDKVAILSATSYKWSLCDYGIICMGGVTVSIYPTLLPDQIEYIIKNSDSRLVFVENSNQLEKIKSIKSNCPKLKYIVVMDNSAENAEEDKNIYNLNNFMIVPKSYIDENNLSFDSLVSIAKPEDLLTLIYTSGTTGQPKGVMLTHNNLISNIKAVAKVSPVSEDDSFLSFLPISHVLERMAGHFYPFSHGCSIYYAESIETVAEDMIDVGPTMAISVPRFFEKIHSKIKLGVNQSSGFKRKLFNWSIKIGKDYSTLVYANRKIPYLLKIKRKIANKLVYSKIKNRLGGNIKNFISGGAPLNINVAEFFAAIDIQILEGYGLTETSPVLTSNVPGHVKFGTVGYPLHNVDIKIDSDGEILAKGPNIMLGYYKNEDATKEVIDKEGWFRTGDIGEIDKGGYLVITDRKKSIIVTSGGKNIAPAPLEKSLNTSQYIEQSIVIGDKKNFISALIVPDFEKVKMFLNKKNIEIDDPQAIIEYHDVIQLIENEVANAMKSFAKFETVKKIALIHRQFSIEKGEMTPKMSIVRKVVIKNFASKIESIYNDNI